MNIFKSKKTSFILFFANLLLILFIAFPSFSSYVTTQWGNISGTLSNQTDLQSALDAKLGTSGDGSSLTGLTWSQLSSTPTTLSGYGITDAQGLDADLTSLAGGITSGSLVEGLGNGNGFTAVTTTDLNMSSASSGDFVTVDSSKNLTNTTPADALSSMLGAWTDYGSTSTINGFSSAPTAHILYKEVGDLVLVKISISGTSDTSGVLNFTLPDQSADDSAGANALAVVVDHDAGTAFGKCSMSTNTTTVNCYTGPGSGNGWNAAGGYTKAVYGEFFYAK